MLQNLGNTLPHGRRPGRSLQNKQETCWDFGAIMILHIILVSLLASPSPHRSVARWGVAQFLANKLFCDCCYGGSDSDIYRYSRPKKDKIHVCKRCHCLDCIFDQVCMNSQDPLREGRIHQRTKLVVYAFCSGGSFRLHFWDLKRHSRRWRRSYKYNSASFNTLTGGDGISCQAFSTVAIAEHKTLVYFPQFRVDYLQTLSKILVCACNDYVSKHGYLSLLQMKPVTLRSLKTFS